MKRKAALAAVLFSAAVNMNGCAYGPPPDEAVMNAPRQDTTSITSEIQESESETVTSETEKSVGQAEAST